MRAHPSLPPPAERMRVLIPAGLALVTLLATGALGQERPVNTLHGVVVSKKDGKPLENVRVAMAHAEKGFLSIGQGGVLDTYGSDEKIMLFFTKLNGKTTCEGMTDGEGRFTFKSFTSPGQKYNFVASHAEHGVALLRGMVPSEHQDEPLRIEMDEPSFITTDWKPPSIGSPFSRTRWENVSLTVAPESDDAGPENNIWFRIYAPGRREGKEQLRLGPLPGGQTYRFSRELYMNPPGYSAKLFERDVFVKPGETVDVAVGGNEGTTITGCVTGVDDKPLSNVSVTATIAEPWMVMGAVTDDEGRYTVTGVPPGKHKLELLRHTVRTGPG